MKKLLCTLLAMLMLFSASSAFAKENETVEISFFVGNETFTVNGETLTAEKPYLVGKSVVMVPLRVIAEAFGATTEWIGETKSIALNGPNGSILLQIDNPVANINGTTEPLSVAPQLSENGCTMVPLRFLSNSFHVAVISNYKTGEIIVTNETDDIIETIETTPEQTTVEEAPAPIEEKSSPTSMFIPSNYFKR